MSATEKYTSRITAKLKKIGIRNMKKYAKFDIGRGISKPLRTRKKKDINKYNGELQRKTPPTKQ